MDQEKLTKFVISLPNGIFDLLYLGRRVKKDNQLLDAKAQFLCSVVDKQSLPIEQETVQNSREQLEKLSGLFAGEEIAVGSVEDFSIPGPGGLIPVRLYKPENCPDKSPVLIFYHGGGFIRGSINSHDGLCQRLVKHGGFSVLSVEYRLAPEHTYPAAVDDAYAALLWVQKNGATKGLDTDLIGVGGDSSGGNLAAVTSQDALRCKTPPPLFQLLIYPTTDSNFDSRSHQLFSEGFFLTAEKLNWYRDLYLPDRNAWDDERASPTQRRDLTGLPPALILTAGFDPLRDEAEAYANALKEAGVPTGVIRYESMVHGFMSLTGLLDKADEAIEMTATTLKSMFVKD